MIVREITVKDQKAFDEAATHPLQSYAWGEFRKKTNLKVERIGIWQESKLSEAMQVTIHKLPKTSYTIGYFPKGTLPNASQLNVLKEIGKRNNCVAIKLEPNVKAGKGISKFLTDNGCVRGRPLFTKYSFQIDLTKSEEKLLAQMKSKTRYNVRLAQRKGVRVFEDNSLARFEEYLKLMLQTTRRQKFYAHTPEYHKKMWQEMHKANIARLLVAYVKKTVLTSWVVFKFNKVLYYPYGASSNEHRELMASNLMMWEAIRYGKTQGCKTFDLWGALGPQADPKDPWYGFHKFKEGYGGELVEYVGSYDLVLNSRVYKLYRMADEVRWKMLKTKAALLSWKFKT